MSMRAKFLGVFLAFAVGGGGAHASVLSYDETTDGELDGSQTFSLGIGANTVAGTFSSGFNGVFPTSGFDSFAITVPAMGTLTSISLAFSLTNDGASSPGVFIDFDGGSQSFQFLTSISPMSVFTDRLPLGEGTYAFEHLLTSCDCSQGESWKADYTWTLNVEGMAVPEPATLALVGAGLAGLGVAARRRRKA